MISKISLNTAQKMKLFLETVDLVTFTQETLNGKLHFLCSAIVTVSIDRTSIKSLHVGLFEQVVRFAMRVDTSPQKS